MKLWPLAAVSLLIPLSPQLTPRPAGAETWAIQNVDVGSNSGAPTSLGLSEEGFPVIAYHTSTDRLLKYAALSQQDKVWNLQFVDVGGEFISVAVDSSGIVHVGYLDAVTLRLNYWRNNQGQTQIQVIDSEPNKGGFGFYNSIQVDAQGTPHISYYHTRDPDGSVADHLKYATLNGASWTTEYVDSNGQRGKYNSLALDASGNPQISYFDNIGALRYAKRNPGSGAWTTEAVDSINVAGLFNSIAIDALGRPHISYVAGTTRKLRYAFFDGTSWTSENVDDVGTLVNFSVTSIALDKSGNPHISYYDSANHSLKYASRVAGAWTIQTVDREGDVGAYSSLKIDSQDRPIISYFDATTVGVKIAYGNFTDTDGDGIPDGFDPCPADADCNRNGTVDGREGGILVGAASGAGSRRLIGDESLFGCGTLSAMGGSSPPPGGGPPADLLILLGPVAYLLHRKARLAMSQAR